MVYDNTKVASGVRDGDARAEHRDVVAVDPVQKLTWAKPRSAEVCLRIQPGVDVCDTCSELANCQRDIFDGRVEVHLAVVGIHV